MGILSISSYTSKQGLSQFLTLMSKSLVTGCLGGRRRAKFPILCQAVLISGGQNSGEETAVSY